MDSAINLPPLAWSGNWPNLLLSNPATIVNLEISSNIRNYWSEDLVRKFPSSNSKENHPAFGKTIWTLVGKMKKFEFFFGRARLILYTIFKICTCDNDWRAQKKRKKNWEREMDERDAWRLKTLKRWTCAISLNAKIYKIHAQKVHVVLNCKCLYTCTRGPCLHRLKHSTLLFFMPISLAEHLAVLIYSHYVCMCVHISSNTFRIYTDTRHIQNTIHIWR